MYRHRQQAYRRDRRAAHPQMLGAGSWRVTFAATFRAVADADACAQAQQEGGDGDQGDG
jgi:hypothetical protein